MKILVLMSTYNGEKFLREQIESVLSQDLPKDCSLGLLVRDDGSSDNTIKILDEYKNKEQLTWYSGENLKPAKSFWNLVNNCGDAEYYAFCDQDDVWNKDKICRAIEKIQDTVCLDKPVLYCSNVMVADRDLNPIRKMNQGDMVADFAHSLVYSLAPGCTFVFNNKARKELVKYSMENNYVIIHDWLAYKIVAMLGSVIYDTEPTMLYRQHGNNVIGAGQTGIKKFLSKAKRIIKSNDCVRSNSARSLLNVYENQLDDSKRELLKTVAFYKSEKKYKKDFLKSKSFSVNRNTDFFLKCLIRWEKV